MRAGLIRTWVFAGVLLLACGGTAWSDGPRQTILIRGGSVAGLYNVAANALCDILNDAARSGLQCFARMGPGSTFNLNAVLRRLVDFGIAQSDRQWQAWTGQRNWRGEPAQDLRSVFGLHAEAVLLVVRRGSLISGVEDLRHKHVNLGNPGSGHRGNAEDVLALYGIDHDTDLDKRGLYQGDASAALISGELDAFFYTVGNPSIAVAAVADAVLIDLINLDGPRIRAFVAQHPYFAMTTVPAGTYRNVDYPVTTFGPKATVVAHAGLSELVVYDFVRTVFENLDRLRAAHPAFAALDPAGMLDGLAAPLHPGAERYYRERGWLPR